MEQNGVKVRWIPFEIKTTIAIKTSCFSTEMQFSMQMSLINETCSPLRPHSTSTIGELIIGTQVSSVKYNFKQCFKAVVSRSGTCIRDQRQ